MFSSEKWPGSLERFQNRIELHSQPEETIVEMICLTCVLGITQANLKREIQLGRTIWKDLTKPVVRMANISLWSSQGCR